MMRTLAISRRGSNMDGLLQLSKGSDHDNHRSFQNWHCDHDSDDFDTSGNLLSTQVAAASLNSSSPDSCPDSDLLPPELQNLDSSNILSSDVASSNPTANYLLPKPSIWGTGDSEYSWAQESLSRSSGSMDESSLLSSDNLGNDTSRLLETPKTDILLSQWTNQIPHSQSSSIQPALSTQMYQRRSWQSTDDHSSIGLLQAYNSSFPALSSSSCGGASFDGSKLHLEYLAGERNCNLGNFEATSVYDSMARKLHLSGLENSSGNDLTVSPLSSMGFPSLQMGQNGTESSDNLTSGLFLQHGLLQQKSYPMSPLDHDKPYAPSKVLINDSRSTFDSSSIMSTSTSNQRFGENIHSSKLLLDSLSGNSVLRSLETNIPVHTNAAESLLASNSYWYPPQKKSQTDSLDSLRRWPHNPKDYSSTPGLDNASRYTFTTCGEKDESLFETWPSTSVGHNISVEINNSLTASDSRKRFLQIGVANNTNSKRLHMDTQNNMPVVPVATGLKRSSSWASSLTSTCSKVTDAGTAGQSPYTKSSSRHAVGPALNTNLKPRARQGSANDPQSIAARQLSLNTTLKPRARQGSANDPQSIAARHRRERISERLKILQDLVPNGSKVDLVTMLEKAINYVKFLQVQVKVLTTDDYWPSNEKGAAPCTALPNFEDMEGALKTLVAQAEKEAQALAAANNTGQKQSPEPESSSSPGDSD